MGATGRCGCEVNPLNYRRLIIWVELAEIDEKTDFTGSKQPIYQLNGIELRFIGLRDMRGTAVGLLRDA